MDLRVTFTGQVSRALAQNQRRSADLFRLQQEIYAGKQLLRPSDDPAAWTAASRQQALDARLAADLGNLQEAQNRLAAGSAALTDAADVLARAGQIALEGGQSGTPADGREALAAELDVLLGRLQEAANARSSGRYLFAGAATATAPFAGDPAGPLRYLGGADEVGVPVGPNHSVPAYLNGADVYQPRSRGATQFTGGTGASPGAGTDSATGRGTLLVSHTATTYAPGSGVQPGADSAAGDTALGPAGAHRLTVTDASGTGAFGTVALNGGPPVQFTSASTNLRVTGPAGEVVYVDTTAVTAGFSGDVDITSGGTLSVDGGATSVALDFSANQVVTDGATGAATNVDTTGVRRAGSERLEYPGTYDAFQALQALRDDLRNAAGLTEPEQLAAVSRDGAEIDRVREHILGVLGRQGASAQALDGLQYRIEDARLEAQKLADGIEGGDLAAIAIRLQAQQNLLTATQAATVRLFDQGLVDFLR